MLRGIDVTESTTGPVPAGDVRVQAVCEVLRGRPVTMVAYEYHLDVLLLQRWVNAFMESGSARVLNRPQGDLAAQRDRFLAAFAHEMRTPLTVALGWIDILSDEALPPIVATTMGRLHTALDQLEQRTVDVELLASAALGRLRVHKQPTPLADLIEDIPRLTGALGAGDNVELNVDASLFKRVLQDVWEAGHTPPTPRRVHLEVDFDGPWAEISVIRLGDPIAVEVLQALLEPFHLNHDNTGVTLGLYLARALSIAHGGTIGVEQDDRTARFWVRIPSR